MHEIQFLQRYFFPVRVTDALILCRMSPFLLFMSNVAKVSKNEVSVK